MQSYTTHPHTVPLAIKLFCSILMWFPLIISFITVWFWPLITIIYNIIISLYIILTFLLMYASCLFAMIKQKYLTNKFFNSPSWTDIQKQVEYELLDGEKILHIVIIPIYKEDLSIIDSSLESLAKQNVPMLICIALEERELNSETKYNDIIHKYEKQFTQMIISIHPMNIPNHVSGKQSNCDHASRIAIEYYEKYFKNSYRFVMFTLSDCDSIWCTNYFLYLNYLCAKNNLNNFDHIAYVPNITNLQNFSLNRMLTNWVSVFRLMGIHGQCRRLGFIRLFSSEYHIPLYLIKRIDFWDGDIISEDVHMRNKLAILDENFVQFKSTYLPCDNTTPTDVNSIFGTIIVLWKQTIRWNLSIYDFYYFIHMLLLNICEQYSYESFRANSWKILFQIFNIYENSFFIFLAPLLNFSFWILYFCYFNYYPYNTYTRFLLVYVNPSFLILQLILVILYSWMFLNSNEEITNTKSCSLMKKMIFILGMIPFSIFNPIFQGIAEIYTWIYTLKSNIIHSDSTPKTINKH